MIRTNGLSLAGFKAGEKTPDGKNEGVYKPQSEEVLRKKYNKNIKVLFQLSLLPVIAEKPITVTIKGKFSPEKKVGSILYFKNRTELKLCIREVKSQKVDDCKATELISMPDKYSGQNVASFSLFDNRFFTYPTDKRKKTIVDLKIKFTNDSFCAHYLHRGQFLTSDEGYGQFVQKFCSL